MIPGSEMAKSNSAKHFVTPASFAQRRLWLLNKLYPDDPSYNIPLELDMEGELDKKALLLALRKIVARHESLRTCFFDRNGELYQAIYSEVLTDLPVEVVNGDDVLLINTRLSFARQPFNLQTPGLIKVKLLQLTPEHHKLLISLHHIIADGWSLGVMVKELSFAYSQLRLGNEPTFDILPIQYADFTSWHRKLVEKNKEQLLSFWREQVKNAPKKLVLPYNNRRQTGDQISSGSNFAFALDTDISSTLRTFASSTNATIFQTLLAAFEVFLARLCDQQDFLIGTVSANRNNIRLSDQIGFFVNTLLVRSDMKEEITFAELMEKVKSRLILIQENDDLPFELLVDDLNPDREVNRNPLFQVLVVGENAPLPGFSLHDLRVKAQHIETGTSKFDLTLFVFENPENIQLIFEYSTLFFEKETIETWARMYTTLLKQLTADPNTDTWKLTSISEQEQKHLDELAMGRKPNTDFCSIPQLIQNIVLKYPDLPAVNDGLHPVNFFELNRFANALARKIKDEMTNIGNNKVIAIYLDRSPILVAALLAVWKAGAAFLCLDTEHPVLYTKSLLTRSNSRICITSKERFASLDQPGLHLVESTDTNSIDKTNDDEHFNEIQPEDLAYVVFTSGSSGEPKGIEITHKSISNFVVWQADELKLTQSDTCILKTRVCFDAVWREIFPILIAGGCLHVEKDDCYRNVLLLKQKLEENNISTFHCTPSLLQLMIESNCFEKTTSLRVVCCGGEVLTTKLATKFRQVSSAILYNVYGPSEATVDATYHIVGQLSEFADTIPIGKPIQGLKASIYDRHNNVVPLGTIGEIFLGGLGIAKGYLEGDRQTNDRFITDPRKKNERIYKTGDRGVMRKDGTIEYLGRIDQQIKIAGVRIEPQEIEVVLQQLPIIAKAAVLLVENELPAIEAYLKPSGELIKAYQQRSSDLVSKWLQIFNSQIHKINDYPEDLREFIGWENSFTRKPYSAQEMQEWLDTTVNELIRDCGGQLLEIGCGNGLLAFRLAPYCDQYIGLDFSRNFISECIEKQNILGIKNTRFIERNAEDLLDFKSSAYRLIILNSVIQYFPGIKYLENILLESVRLLEDDGTIFIGDIKDFRLYAHYQYSLAYHRNKKYSPDMLSMDAVLNLWKDHELAIDPAWFSLFAERNNLHVSLEFRRGLCDTEMNKYRYNVFLSKNNKDKKNLPSEYIWNETSAEYILSQARKNLDHTSVVIRKIPNKRIWEEHVSLPKSLLDSWHFILGAGNRISASTNQQPQHPEHLISQLITSKSEVNARLLVSDDTAYFDLLLYPDYISFPMGIQKLRHDKTRLSNYPGLLYEIQDHIPLIRKHLSDRMPSYFIPQRFIFVPDFLLNSSGKTDKGLLQVFRKRIADADKATTNTASATEQWIIDLWENILQVPNISVDDNFFLIGGHSLLATRVHTHICQKFGEILDLRHLFEYQTVKQLANAINTRKKKLIPDPAIAKASYRNLSPLSSAQLRLWLINKIDPESTVYNMSNVFRLRGDLQNEELKLAILKIVERHDCLRSNFIERAGKPLRIIHSIDDFRNSAWMFEEHMNPSDIGHLNELAIERIKNDAKTPYNLESDPLLRIRLIQLEDSHYLLAINMHHIVSDGWSIAIFINEISSIYNSLIKGKAHALPDITNSYFDFALWQQKRLKGKRLERLENFWHTYLGDFPPQLSLPSDMIRPAENSFQGTSIKFSFSSIVTRQVTQFSQSRGITSFMSLLAVFEVLLSRFSQQKEFVIGTVTANRLHPSFENMIGFFVNALPIKADLRGVTNFDDVCRQVRAKSIAAFQHQELPFEKIIEILNLERDNNFQPLFQVLFVQQNNETPNTLLDGIEVVREKIIPPGAMFDYCLEFRETPQGLDFILEFNTDLFTHESAQKFAERFSILTRELMDHPFLPLSSHQWMLPSEKEQLFKMSESVPATYNRDQPIHELIWSVAKNHPNRIAVDFGSEKYSYKELCVASNNVSIHVNKLIEPGVSVVGILIDRSVTLIASMLGVLRSGGSFMILDKDNSKQQLLETIQAAGLTFVLTDSDYTFNNIACYGTKQWLIENVKEAAQITPISLPAGADHTAFIASTSGTSGKPKCIPISHASLTDRILANQQILPPLTTSDNFMHCYKFNYDGGILSLFWPLIGGSTIHFVPLEKLGDSNYLNQFIHQKKITVIDTIPLLIKAIFSAPETSNYSSLRMVVTGGEECKPSVVEQVFSKTSVLFVNQYGPAEATLNATSWSCTKADWQGKVSIGIPLPNTKIWVVDAQNNLAPIGVTGEILIGGANITSGYLNATAENAFSFGYIETPVGLQRYYRTGDLAKWTNSKNLEFIGRADQQFKIRGIRIEPLAIEKQLLHDPLIKEINIVNLRNNDENNLTAVVVPNLSIFDNRFKDELDYLDNKRVLEWKSSFDKLYESQKIAENSQLDFIGWDNSFTGDSIPVEEMTEWHTMTIKRISKLTKGKVLEIGCGTGLILLSLNNLCEEYTGTDIAIDKIKMLEQTCQQNKIHNVRLIAGDALSIWEDCKEEFDLIIMNSIAQYFPSERYLTEVLDRALSHLPQGATIFLGDIRHNGLQQIFSSSVEIERADPGELLDVVYRRAFHRIYNESELCIQPSYFYERLKGKNLKISVLLKEGNFNNELTSFRYDVILQKGQDQAVGKNGIIKWNICKFSRSLPFMEKKLSTAPKGPFLIRSIPNERLEKYVYMDALLRDNRSTTKTVSGLKRKIGLQSKQNIIRPTDIIDMAERNGYEARLTFDLNKNDGSYHAYLIPMKEEDTHTDILPDHFQYPDQEFTNDPLFAEKSILIRREIIKTCDKILPTYLTLNTINIVPQMPVLRIKESNIKAWLSMMPENKINPREAEGTFLENELICMWSKLLKADKIRVNSDFFSLGGHSLVASQLINEINSRFAVNLPVKTVFQVRTVSGLAAAARAAILGTTAAGFNAKQPFDYSDDTPVSVSQGYLIKHYLKGSMPRHYGFCVLLSLNELKRLRHRIAKICNRNRLLVAKLTVANDRYSWNVSNAQDRSNLISVWDKQPGISDEIILRRAANQILKAPDPVTNGVWRLDFFRKSDNSGYLAICFSELGFDGISLRNIIRLLLSENSFNNESPDNVEVDYLQLLNWQNKYPFKDNNDFSSPSIFDSIKAHLSSLLWEIKCDEAITKQEHEYIVDLIDSSTLTKTAQNFSTTPFIIFLSSLVLSLEKKFKKSRYVFAITSSLRTEAYSQNIIGPLANYLLLLIETGPDEQIDKLIAKAEKSLSKSLATEKIPYSLARINTGIHIRAENIDPIINIAINLPGEKDHYIKQMVSVANYIGPPSFALEVNFKIENSGPTKLLVREGNAGWNYITRAIYAGVPEVLKTITEYQHLSYE